MRLSRRDLLKWALLTPSSTLAATAGTSPWNGADEQAPRPHYIVLIHLSGGVDTVLTVDPKISAASGGSIDCGYGPDERIRGKRRFYGPQIGPLIRHESDLCLIHGVRIDTVAHPDGEAILTRGGSPIVAAR